MKLLIMLLVNYTFVYAGTLSISQQQSLKTYNHKPSLKKTVEKRMAALAKINKDKAMQIAKSYCFDKNLDLKLTHKNSYLFYQVSSKYGQLYINALDGSLINKENLDD